MSRKSPARLALLGIGAALAGVAGAAAVAGSSSNDSDRFVPVGLAGVAAGLIILVWTARGMMFRLNSSVPSSSMVAVVLTGRPAMGPLDLGAQTWLALADPSTPRRPTHWQRIMWNPALDAVDGPINVQLHGELESRGRSVVELPDGTCLVPIEPWQRQRPRDLHQREPSELRTAFVLPAGTRPPWFRPWWFPGLALAGIGVSLGVVLGFLDQQDLSGLQLSAFLAALLVNGWALAGNEP